jgi:2-amino-4-hydroxy-6-hydroxymethyldihydropteridine diphosphokinase
VPEVFVSLGSNIEPGRHLPAGIAALRQAFGEVRVSTIYRCPAVGFDGPDFHNAVAAFEAAEPVEAVAATLRRIEEAAGRERSDVKFSSRTLDLDLLLYGDAIFHDRGLDIPRGEITRYAFVLGPLAELAPDRRHPLTGERFDQLWQAFDHAGQSLVPLPD